MEALEESLQRVLVDDVLQHVEAATVGDVKQDGGRRCRIDLLAEIAVAERPLFTGLGLSELTKLERLLRRQVPQCPTRFNRWSIPCFVCSARNCANATADAIILDGGTNDQFVR